MSRRSSRRALLKQTAGLAAGAMLLPYRRVWGSSTQSVNDAVAVAVVGIGGQGQWNVERLLEAGANIVALCDVDERMAGESRSSCPNAPFYHDFRRMLDKQHKDIDAVLVATPDHTHAIASMAAMKLGKHVYCEKPLTHSVYECRQMMRQARERKLVTQMGTQIHAGDNYRRVVELVQSGAIGSVCEVHVWCPTSWSGGGDRPKETPPVPSELDWDLWLGPAPRRPYHPAYLPAKWRGWWDFGGGGHADMACHYMDLAHWALDLRRPTAIEAEGPPLHDESAPPWLVVRYEYPARGDKPPVKLTWYAGGEKPAILEQRELPGWGRGVLFSGEKGVLMADYQRHQLLPEAQYADFKRPEPFIPDSIGHHKEWLEACKTGGPTTCNFEYAGALTETVLLGNVAYRSGSRIEWDAQRMRVTSAPQAERFLQREYRAGWSL